MLFTDITHAIEYKTTIENISETAKAQFKMWSFPQIYLQFNQNIIKFDIGLNLNLIWFSAIRMHKMNTYEQIQDILKRKVIRSF